MRRAFTCLVLSVVAFSGIALADVSNDCGSPRELTQSESFTEDISGTGDVDWFHVTVPQGKALLFQVIPPAGVDLKIGTYIDCAIWATDADFSDWGGTEFHYVPAQFVPISTAYEVKLTDRGGETTGTYRVLVDFVDLSAPMVNMWLTQGVYEPGSHFGIDITVTNDFNNQPCNASLFLVLIIDGQFYFYPSFGMWVDSASFDLASGDTKPFFDILGFDVPSDFPNFGPMDVVAAAINNSTGEFSGISWSVVSFRNTGI